MAKQYIVKSTIHALLKKGGEKVVIPSSATPQNIPKSLVDDLLKRGVIEAFDGDAAPKARGQAAGSGQPAAGAGEGDDDDDGTGDDNSGD